MSKLIIAGPCSAESRSQVIDTAVQLKGVDYFRAGLWKPRSRPDSFVGVGEAGLGWLSEVKSLTSLKVCTEVATAQHVEACFKAGLDAVWVGARTTTNPFLVQEVADALAGSEIVVFVKNPVNPDVQLWAGAVERIQKAGISQIGLIHRGYSSYAHIKYRNAPMWGTVFEMRSIFPDIPVICDASHISGSGDLVPEIAQKAMDLGLDGLMIETHPDPESALSDSAQQITPSAFAGMMSSLSVRGDSSLDVAFNSNLERLREEIDICDAQIIDALASRMDISRRIGRLKKDNNVSVLQSGRWDEVMERICEMSNRKGLGEEFVRELYNLIHNASVEEQS